MKGRLADRLLLYFTGVLLAFALVIGVSLGRLFLDYTESHHLEEMQRLARVIAEGITKRPETAAMMHAGGHHGGGQHHGRYCRRSFSDNAIPSGSTGRVTMGQETFIGSFLKELNNLSQSEVWIMDALTHSFSRYGEAGSLEYDAFPPEAEEMIQKVLQGQTVSSRDFTPLLEAPSITVGTPLYDEQGAIVGALLLHRTLEGLRDTQEKAMLFFGICIVIALSAAALFVAWLTRRVLRPVERMESFAGELAEGNYHLRSGIEQEDEIGRLAKSLDTLALRLEDARAQKEQLDKMRQDFFANISHELRTPITVLRGTLELLSSGLVKTEEKRQEYLHQLTANVLGLQRLVQDLFELSRLQNAEFAIESSELNLGDPLQDAVQSARQVARAKDIEILLPSLASPLRIHGDYGRLRQMFLTILDNAVKFSPEGGTIRVDLSHEDTAWRIDLRDQGCGIPPEELPHIFDRFRSRREGKNPEGTGLGLPIAREIARRHGMEISCHSEVGKGTTFTISGH